MGDRRRQTLSEQWLLCPNTLVTRQIRKHRGRRPLLAAHAQTRKPVGRYPKSPGNSFHRDPMANMIGRQVCFRLDKSLPDVPPSGPICLLDTQSEALSALLQVFACGEESASLGFAYLQNSHVDDMARAGLARIAREELTHERLLRSLRAALPVPPKDKELRHAMF